MTYIPPGYTREEWEQLEREAAAYQATLTPEQREENRLRSIQVDQMMAREKQVSAFCEREGIGATSPRACLLRAELSGDTESAWSWKRIIAERENPSMAALPGKNYMTSSGLWEANPDGVSGRVVRGYRHWRSKR